MQTATLCFQLPRMKFDQAGIFKKLKWFTLFKQPCFKLFEFGFVLGFFVGFYLCFIFLIVIPIKGL